MASLSKTAEQLICSKRKCCESAHYIFFILSKDGDEEEPNINPYTERKTNFQTKKQTNVVNTSFDNHIILLNHLKTKVKKVSEDFVTIKNELKTLNQNFHTI